MQESLMDDYVIEIKDLSLAYPVYARPMDILMEITTGTVRHDQFWALRDISFALKEKQRLGIIGPNGSGKSSLLKMICGNLKPTSGSIRVEGEISALLSLVPALYMDDTGLKNIEFNLIANGCPKRRLRELTEEIIEFSELGPFIYQPVKTYSSGMLSRLTFTIGTAIEPEILVVDEVLSVGDAYFVGKATKRMHDLCEQGKALLFVSHSTTAVHALCDTVLWLDNGSIRMYGPTSYVLKHYEEDYKMQNDEQQFEGNKARREKSILNVNPSEIIEDFQRIRLVANGSKFRFKNSHYVRRIAVSTSGSDENEIPFQLTELAREHPVGWIDVWKSEWGRVFTHADSECRMLCTRAGTAPGGHIILRSPSGEANWHVNLVCEIASKGEDESIKAEFVNEQLGEWETAELIEKTQIDSEWSRFVFGIKFPEVTRDHLKQVQEKIKTLSMPDVTIEEVTCVISDGNTSVVTENEPFEILVRIVAHRTAANVSVNILIERSDGVYVFWQPSGWNDKNIEDLEGEAIVRFVFDTNPIGAGIYLVTAVVTTEWDISSYNDFGFREVYDRKVNALTFTVSPQYPKLDLGQINIQVPVVIEKSKLTTLPK